MPKTTKLKPVTLSWEEIIPEILTTPPEGYMSAVEIAKKRGMSLTQVRVLLSNARKSGKIDAVQVAISGIKTWYYRGRDGV